MQSRVSVVPRRYLAGDYAANSRARVAEQAQVRFRAPCWEVTVLFLICTLDMLSSAMLFQQQVAVEANPLLRPFADAGLTAFVSAKMVTFVPALAAADWYSRRRPEFIQNLLRIAIIAYLGIYILSVAGQFIG